VLDKLLEQIGPGPDSVPENDQGEDEITWSPLA
jgi:GTPase